jgi:hypothetical protein
MIQRLKTVGVFSRASGVASNAIRRVLGMSRYVPLILWMVASIGVNGGMGRLAFAGPHPSRFVAVLESMLIEAKRHALNGVTPIAIMDLDETAIDSTPRRFAAFKKVFGVSCGMSHRSPECERFERLTLGDFYQLNNRYSFKELLARVGLADSDWAKAFDQAIVDEYLSGRHVELDLPYCGADQWVRRWLSQGGEVRYVSSRYQDTLGEPTLLSLSTLGMMGDGDQVRLFLRMRGQSSIEFKKKSFMSIREEVENSDGFSKVIGVFENEPENLNAMAEQFGAATRVFIRGANLSGGEVVPGTHHLDCYLNSR